MAEPYSAFSSLNSVSRVWHTSNKDLQQRKYLDSVIGLWPVRTKSRSSILLVLPVYNANLLMALSQLPSRQNCHAVNY
jgi:hypothetical protein